MEEIHKKNWLYSILRPFVDIMIRRSYEKIEYDGLENIPTDGAIIFTPNHTNCLQDALVLLAADNKTKCFVARADIFKIKAALPVLNFSRIMPMGRARDGHSAIRQNGEIMERSAKIIADGVPFCIMPEGQHRPKYNLLPLGKGTFRIALMANDELAGKMPVYIVPVGEVYGNHYRFRSSVLIKFGKPINISEYVSEHPEMEQPELISNIKDILAERLKELVMYIPDDERYDGILEACKIYSHLMSGAAPTGKYLSTRLRSSRQIIELLTTSEHADKLIEEAASIRAQRIAKGISANSMMVKSSLKDSIYRMLSLLISFPLFLAALVLGWPMVVISEIIGTKVKDKAFFNSIRCGVYILLMPILLLINAIVLLISLPWWAALIGLVITFMSVPIVYGWTKSIRLIISNIKYLFNKSLRYRVRTLKVKLSKEV